MRLPRLLVAEAEAEEGGERDDPERDPRQSDGEPQQRAPVELVRLEVGAEGGEVDGQRGDLEDGDAEERRRRHQHVQRVLPRHADRVLLVGLGRDARRHHAALELVPLPGDRSRRDADGARTERDDSERVEEGGAVGAGGTGRERRRGRRGARGCRR